MNWVIEYSYLIPLLPLAGAAIAGFLGARWLKGQSHWPIWLTVLASAALSVMLTWHMWHAVQGGWTHQARDWFTWIDAGKFKVQAGFFFDPLTAVMLCVVTGIGFLITVYAAGYMKGEKGYWRFFAYLGLFIFMMTILVMGDNFIMLYLGWEGVGLCSYLLIGYYYDKPSAREAAKKAFLVNRIGDFGFGIGIMLIFMAFGTVSYFGGGSAHTGVLEMATRSDLTAFQTQALQWIPFCLMLGAFGKSAQFPLYVWLPDAMEGPTPVSALIHAATMVTAGVYMIARCATLFVTNDAAMWTIAIVGAFTAIFAATIALRQFDLKKVFAYSTVSQLGFMFVGMGVLAPVAGLFHLVTHAFFKALLFLSSGVVMHAMLGDLDMRKMSGLKKLLPKTRWLMLIGCMALAGVPFLSGFFSKDSIIVAAWERSNLLGVVLLFTAFLTAYYTFRLYFRVFEGPFVGPEPKPHDDHGHGHDDHAVHHNHEPAVMILPLVVLAIGAIFAGYLNWPAGHKDDLGHLAKFLGHSSSLRYAHAYATRTQERVGDIDNPAWGVAQVKVGQDLKDVHATHKTFMIISGLVAALGIYLAYLMHLKYRDLPQRLALKYAAATRVLDARYWVDEIYQAGIVEPLRGLGRAFFWIDRWVVGGLVWLAGFIPQLFGFTLAKASQRGYLQGYALTMLVGVVIILLWVLT